ncbi:peroxiredoxin family protein [Fimbriimonas ginsengisoli]|uniref:Alkyl hydroperoxide reductase/ Thiol specific antioxidant/ Mal allergen n=1 Tax=Fimbriimonas ginsengisoli Gsoil 348 TaxID=661478 RepID=A0A068NVV8_FIMGI|nr:redoxin domain-containing protein [Fimbriimonas ginsengisoli]AIE87653.1 alkyl hydroperoxide reductase/ Thiol specific antioxidant/ Mal allergen [Fimbriimonas ginsengisoli Gsoil 348]
MRLAYLSIPAGLALACAGAALMLASREPHSASGTFLEPNVRHLVTQAMMEETAAQMRKVAPTMSALDSEGKPVTLGVRNAKRPQFVYFVLDGCPCSYDAEPLFHKLSRKFLGKVDFVSVTNAGQKKAHDWSVQMLVNYPVVPDPEKKIIHAYEAKASVYSALLSTDGHIIKMWPGYSVDLLKDINAEMTKAANVPLTPFDPEYAPTTRATGCAF